VVLGRPRHTVGHITSVRQLEPDAVSAGGERPEGRKVADPLWRPITRCQAEAAAAGQGIGMKVAGGDRGEVHLRPRGPGKGRHQAPGMSVDGCRGQLRGCHGKAKGAFGWVPDRAPPRAEACAAAGPKGGRNPDEISPCVISCSQGSGPGRL
jgi:hypothetical protein